MTCFLCLSLDGFQGRTGVMSSCFLLYYYRDEYHDPLQTLRFYAQQRTSNGKGVTIPSQRRYVEYFGHLLNHQVFYTVKQILFTGLLITYEQNSILNSSRIMIVVNLHRLLT
jgi:hypothetical protein